MRWALPLGELRALARLLEAGLLALLDPRVAGEEAALLELGAQVGVGLHQRAGDPVPQGAGLGGHAPAVDAGGHVHARAVARGLQGLAGHALELHAREDVVQRAAVDAVGAVARLEDHTGDGVLALSGGLVTGVLGQVERLAGQRLVVLVLGVVALGQRALLGLELHAGQGLLGLAAGALLLEHQVGLQVGAGDDVLVGGGRCAGGPPGGRLCLGGRRLLGRLLVGAALGGLARGLGGLVVVVVLLGVGLGRVVLGGLRLGLGLLRLGLGIRRSGLR